MSCNVSTHMSMHMYASMCPTYRAVANDTTASAKRSAATTSETAANSASASAGEGISEETLRQLRREAPAGWKVYKSSTLGKPYWFHKSSGVTSWKPPQPDQVPSASATTTGDQVPSASTTTTGAAVDSAVASDRGATEPVSDDRPRAADEAVVLPKGWKKFISSTTGKPYYYHKATKETRWQPPSAED